MLKRWNSAIYDVDLMLKFLHVILTALKVSMKDLKSVEEESLKDTRASTLKRSERDLQVQFKIFRISGEEFLKVRIPKSTLN